MSAVPCSCGAGGCAGSDCGCGGATPCGCCAGTAPETPSVIDNRPGLSAIAYRSGTWSQFNASMLAGLSGVPALAGLTTRSDDDFTIALLDAFSMVCDVLTFYQERIANEAYLGTAVELVSVGELAKLVGYKLRPGLAAAAALAFTMDTPPPLPAGSNVAPTLSPISLALGVGTKAQTVPPPGGQTATFETVEAITAEVEWNAITPLLSAPAAAIVANAQANLRLRGLNTAVLNGSTTTVKVGDALLVLAAGTTELQVVAAVSPDTTTQTTQLQFAGVSDDPTPATPPSTAVQPSSSAALDASFIWNDVKGVLWPQQGDLVAFATTQGWALQDLEDAVNAVQGQLPPGGSPAVAAYAMGIDASVFGHNAVDWNTIGTSLQGVYPDDWNAYTLAQATGGYPWIDLDGVYPILPGSYVVLSDAGAGPSASSSGTGTSKAKKFARSSGIHFGSGGTSVESSSGGGVSPSAAPTVTATILDVAVVNRSAYLVSGKVTSIQLDESSFSPSGVDPSTFSLRGTRLLVQSAQLPVADVQVYDPVGADPLVLDAAYLSLAVGQLVAVSGALVDPTGQTSSEVATIATLALVDGYTQVTFENQLQGSYVRSSVTINANVAQGTHGETTTEVLGSGDASQSFQSFSLRQPPLTYVSANTSTGSVSTLVVRVNGVAWSEVPWLYGSGPSDQVYTVLLGPDGKTWVQFGDGVTGARPGSGTNNIIATYRRGIGSAGLAQPGQISTLMTRPLGLKSVTNPTPSSGAADPETLPQARVNAPLSVMTIDRIVSLSDVADFAAASAGIAKASVAWVWDGARYLACATVAGIAGAPVTAGTLQYQSLFQSMLGASDGTLPLALCSYTPVTFTVAATVTPDPSLVASAVLAAVKAALQSTFSFDARAFAQPVYSSEVILAVQQVTGVVAMTLDGLSLSGGSGVVSGLPANGPTLGSSGLVGAELLVLEPGTLPNVVLAP